MNYKRIYDSLIDKAKSRGLNKKIHDDYLEKHHIVPKCLGGTNEKSNLVLLTAKEHALAHMLLQKIYPDNLKILTAVISMLTGPKGGPEELRGKTVLSLRQASYYRKLFSEKLKGRSGHKQTEETRRKISEANKGRKFTKEQSLAHSKKMRARVITEEWKENISKGMKETST